MSIRRLVLPLFALALLAAPAPAQVAQALAKAKPGDWAAFKMDGSVLGEQAVTLKTTLTAKNDDEATLKVEVLVGGMAVKTHEIKVPLRGNADLSQLLGGTGKAQVKKLGGGAEKVTIGGKKFDAEWVKTSVTADLLGMKVESTMKFWVSGEAPVLGLLKMESDTLGVKTLLELTGAGSAKK